MYFAAVEVRTGEEPDDAIRHFIVTAAELGIRFKRVQTFGTMELARFRFVRFQTDCPTWPPIAARLKEATRSVIVPTVTGYKAHLASGREGPVGLTLMQGIALPGFGRVYIGPSHEHWRAQFTKGVARATPEGARAEGDAEA